MTGRVGAAAMGALCAGGVCAWSMMAARTCMSPPSGFAPAEGRSVSRAAAIPAAGSRVSRGRVLGGGAGGCGGWWGGGRAGLRMQRTAGVAARRARVPGHPVAVDSQQPAARGRQRPSRICPHWPHARGLDAADFRLQCPSPAHLALWPPSLCPGRRPVRARSDHETWHGSRATSLLSPSPRTPLHTTLEPMLVVCVCVLVSVSGPSAARSVCWAGYKLCLVGARRSHALSLGELHATCGGR